MFNQIYKAICDYIKEFNKDEYYDDFYDFPFELIMFEIVYANQD